MSKPHPPIIIRIDTYIGRQLNNLTQKVGKVTLFPEEQCNAKKVAKRLNLNSCRPISKIIYLRNQNIKIFKKGFRESTKDKWLPVIRRNSKLVSLRT